MTDVLEVEGVVERPASFGWSRSRILANMFWLVFERGWKMILGLVVAMVLTRYLGPGDFGLLSYAIALAALGASVAPLGIGPVLAKDLLVDPDPVRVAHVSLVIHLIGGSISWLLVVSIAYFARPGDTRAFMVVALAAGSAVFQFGQVFRYWKEAQVDSKVVAWLESAVFGVSGAVKIAIALMGAPLIAFACVLLAEAALLGVAMLCMLRPSIPRMFTRRIDMAATWALIRRGLPLLLAGLAVFVYMKIDQVMLAAIAGDYEVGIYSAAVRLSEFPYFVPTIVTATLFPGIIQERGIDRVNYIRKFQEIFSALTMASIAIAIAVSLLARIAVHIAFGGEFADAAGVLRIHVWACPLVFLGVAGTRWMIAEDLQWLLPRFTMVGAGLNVLLNVYAIPRFGAMGAAWTTVISYAVAALLADAVHPSTRSLFLMKVRSFNPFWAVKLLWYRGVR